MLFVEILFYLPISTAKDRSMLSSSSLSSIFGLSKRFIFQKCNILDSLLNNLFFISYIYKHISIYICICLQSFPCVFLCHYRLFASLVQMDPQLSKWFCLLSIRQILHSPVQFAIDEYLLFIKKKNNCAYC
jgi:hypothetical protein